MSTTHFDSTQTLDRCGYCQAAIHDHDRYCRHCGVELDTRTALLASTREVSERPTSELSLSASAFVTAPFRRTESRRPVSGSLINLVTTGAVTSVATAGGNRYVRRLTLVLISLPIWLMMVLLSPLDAYTATKAVGQRM